jgi:NRPS condensation-like uncharacterized protein
LTGAKAISVCQIVTKNLGLNHNIDPKKRRREAVKTKILGILPVLWRRGSIRLLGKETLEENDNGKTQTNITSLDNYFNDSGWLC